MASSRTMSRPAREARHGCRAHRSRDAVAPGVLARRRRCARTAETYGAAPRQLVLPGDPDGAAVFRPCGLQPAEHVGERAGPPPPPADPQEALVRLVRKLFAYEAACIARHSRAGGGSLPTHARYSCTTRHSRRRKPTVTSCASPSRPTQAPRRATDRPRHRHRRLATGPQGPGSALLRPTEPWVPGPKSGARRL